MTQTQEPSADRIGDHMEYRRLGASGVKVSVLGFGSWVTFDGQMDIDVALACMEAAHEAGCNFFDNAESYAAGRSEEMMGRALRELAWPRWSYVVTTKLFWGLHQDDPNMGHTLNRKYLMQGIEGSLERFGLDFVDVVYCHRADPDTPMEETVWAMSDMVSQGLALYWGTSEWPVDQIRLALDVAERHHLHKPVTEQSEYNLLKRDKVEVEYADLHADTGYGNTTWSPLASGLLTGKYAEGIPEESRAEVSGLSFVSARAGDADLIARIQRLRPIAERLDCSMAQLVLAWTTRHPMVSSVITGASRPEQVVENFETLRVLPKLDDDVAAEMVAAIEGTV